MMEVQSENINRRSLSRFLLILGGAAAAIAGVALLIGLVEFCAAWLNPLATPGWPGMVQSNWLVKIFISHAGLVKMGSDLNGINPMDIAFLILTGAVALALGQVFHNKSRTWCTIAAGLTVVGLILYLVTQLTGRSTVMLVAIILSSVMLKNQRFGKFTPFAGLIAGVLLLVGDFTVGVQSNIITALFGVGYVLLVGWFLLLASGIYRLWVAQTVKLIV